MRARLRALQAAAMVSLVVCGVTFPIEVLHNKHAEAWGEWVLAPCILVLVAATVGGCIRPDFFRWKVSLVLSTLAILALAGRSYRHAHPQVVRPDPVLEQLLRDTAPQLLGPADAAGVQK